MNDLLQVAVDAHGGLSRWNQLKRVKASLSITGAIRQKRNQGVGGGHPYRLRRHPSLCGNDGCAPHNRKVPVNKGCRGLRPHDERKSRIPGSPYDVTSGTWRGEKLSKATPRYCDIGTEKRPCSSAFSSPTDRGIVTL